MLVILELTSSFGSLGHSGNAVIVYNDASENSYVGPTVDLPPRYGD